MRPVEQWSAAVPPSMADRGLTPTDMAPSDRRGALPNDMQDRPLSAHE
jgi:hypothetical protein